MTTLHDLAARVEREEPNHELWWRAHQAIHPSTEITEHWKRFGDLLVCGAWRDAAAMLMPEGWYCDVLNNADNTITASVWSSDTYADEDITANATGPHAEARARLAAVLRAHGTQR